MTQKFMVLAYLKNRGSLTQLSALEKLGTLRLSARIEELRRLGHPIRTERVAVRTRRGRTMVARYRLGA